LPGENKYIFTKRRKNRGAFAAHGLQNKGFFLITQNFLVCILCFLSEKAVDLYVIKIGNIELKNIFLKII